MLLMCGQVQAGAVFPPAGDPPGKQAWVWRFWIGGQPTKEGRASTEHLAKHALVSVLHDWLRLASLQVSA